MKFITLENGYRYDAGLLDSYAVVKEYERQRALARQSREKAVTDKEKFRTGYNAWMLGRRIGEFAGFFLAQRSELHSHARTYVADGSEFIICTCGLVIEQQTAESPDEGLTKVSLLSAPGHIRVSDRSVQTIFVIDKLKQEAETESRYSFYCQTCGELLDAPIESYRDENEESLAELGVLRQAHNCATFRNQV